MKKVLVYGFEPFGDSDTNVSEETVNLLEPDGSYKLKKVVLPVHFKKSILHVLESYKPDFVIGLGQKNRGRLLEVERTARNNYRIPGENVKRISKQGPIKLYLKLKLKRHPKQFRRDYKSDTYVCNFTRYVVARYIRKNKLAAESTFIHIPRDYDPKKAAGAIERIITEIVSRIE